MSYIFITTPSFNSSATIDRTINSVLSQSGDFKLHLHIQDGGSKDNTVAKIVKWKELIDKKIIPIFCKDITITYESLPDLGMYDAIYRGYLKHSGSPQDWTGWINSDDLIMPGAFAFLSEIDKQLPQQDIDWVTGTSSVDWDDVPVAWGDRPVNQEIIAAGLCDGQHWSFIQQEGTFFRKKLWNQADVERNFKPFKYAGDWNLWRVMAKKNKIYQPPWPLGNFSRREGQISQIQRSSYMTEIENTIPAVTRMQRLLEISNRSGPRLMIESRYVDKGLCVKEYTLNVVLKKYREKILSELANNKIKLNGLSSSNINISANLIALDESWQYPAITERYAYQLVSDGNIKTTDFCYFAFPWATLIDQIQTGNKDSWILISKLQYLSGRLDKSKKIITVCQHIWLKKYLYLLKDAGINTVFWSHATLNDLKNGIDGIEIYPFALYPAQIVKEYKSVLVKKYKFSFIGAKSSEGYISDIRNIIFNELKDTPNTFIKLRSNWHYDNIVYEEQIKKNKLCEAQLAEFSEREIEYKNILSESLFTLCPSGTGPNSIRLWESIESLSIPIVISDSFIPPYESKLWEEVVIQIPENINAIKKIPELIDEIINDKKRLNELMIDLELLREEYGLMGFINPIKKYMLNSERGKILVKEATSSPFQGLVDLYFNKRKGGNKLFLKDYIVKRGNFILKKEMIIDQHLLNKLKNIIDD